MLKNKLKEHSEDLLQRGLYRKRTLVSEMTDHIIQFSSNDYLSLAADPRIKKAYQTGFERYAAGSGGSMVVSGYHPIHQALERAFSLALGVDDCVLFSSGYVANISVIGMLAQFDTHFLIDKAVHASIYDGLKWAGAAYTRYLHNNLADLTKKTSTADKNTILITEGIFSMSGQIAPLAEMAKLNKELLVDEAHAFGILGREGLGSVVQHGLTQKEVPLRVIPLGKAYGAQGAIVAGDGDWINALLQKARPYIYSTAISPAVSYGLLETLDIVRGASLRRVKLDALVAYFRDAIKKSSLKWSDSHTPIQQLQLGCPHRAMSVAEKLQQQSIICLPMRQPTVSKQETGLRIILNYHHEHEHIDYLFKCLGLILE